MNSYQNCNNVIEKFYLLYFYLLAHNFILRLFIYIIANKGKANERFIQEKINKEPIFIKKFFFIKVHCIINKCRIERILPSYNIFIVKIMKLLKFGKLVNICLLLKFIKKILPCETYFFFPLTLKKIGIIIKDLKELYTEN